MKSQNPKISDIEHRNFEKKDGFEAFTTRVICNYFKNKNMNKILTVFFAAAVLLSVGCFSKPKEADATTTAAETTMKQNVAMSAINCQTTGQLIETFSQNKAKFERLALEDKELEWLKITLPDGSCRIIEEDIRRANHFTCEFRDWDGDGLKDKIDNWKWNYRVSLFSKEKNDFSRKVNGVFNGEQWDFDKSKDLKWQFLEGKFGGSYQLYKMTDTQKTVFSEIVLTNDYDKEGQDPMVEVRKNVVESDKKPTFEKVTIDAASFLIKPKSKEETYEAMNERWKQSVERYWRQNLAQFVH